MACIKPYQVNADDGSTFPVPCGKCPECLARRISGWSFRLMQEEKHSESACFITLTYDTAHVPISSNGFMGLRVRDVQLFVKRLRKAQASNHAGSPPVKYYTVGEYGGKTMRPHYHSLLFNVDFSLIQSAWGLGNVHYGSLSHASVGYCLKYMSKQRKIPLHRNDDRLPEFSLMSKGLGKSYLSDAMMQWHKNDLENRMYINIEDGKKIAMPRYFKDKLYTPEERETAGFATLQRMRLYQERLQQLKQDMSPAEYQAAVDAAYQKMYHTAEDGRNKI